MLDFGSTGSTEHYSIVELSDDECNDQSGSHMHTDDEVEQFLDSAGGNSIHWLHTHQYIGKGN